jgi:hypothetical protein
MFMKQQQVTDSGQKLAASKEAAEMKALVAQYHLTQLDSSEAACLVGCPAWKIQR